MAGDSPTAICQYGTWRTTHLSACLVIKDTRSGRTQMHRDNDRICWKCQHLEAPNRHNMMEQGDLDLKKGFFESMKQDQQQQQQQPKKKDKDMESIENNSGAKVVSPWEFESQEVSYVSCIKRVRKSLLEKWLQEHWDFACWQIFWDSKLQGPFLCHYECGGSGFMRSFWCDLQRSWLLLLNPKVWKLLPIHWYPCDWRASLKVNPNPNGSHFIQKMALEVRAILNKSGPCMRPSILRKVYP